MFLPGLNCPVNLAAGGVRRPPTISAPSRWERRSASLQLSTSIIGQQYCKGDDELDVLQIQLRLRYTNLSQQPLILYKGSTLIYRQMISRNVEAALAADYELASSNLVYEEGAAKIGGAQPGKLFVILQPSGSFETTTLVAIPATHGAVKISGAVVTGEHVLQVRVSTWPESESLAGKLRARWRKRGYLWTDAVVSSPMTFTVEKNRPTVTCR